MAINTTVEMFGLENVYTGIQRHIRSFSGPKLSDVALAGAEKARELIVAEMAIPKSGRQYKNRPDLPNRSAAKNEFPAIQTRELVDNMKASRMLSRPGLGMAKLETTSQQAWWQEFGFTTKDGKVHMHPFMRPGVDKHMGEIKAAMRAKMEA
ncbi:MAG: hypothetical protein DRQ45_01845, partial [Gammaproteobacteria bacterium]